MLMVVYKKHIVTGYCNIEQNKYISSINYEKIIVSENGYVLFGDFCYANLN